MIHAFILCPKVEVKWLDDDDFKRLEEVRATVARQEEAERQEAVRQFDREEACRDE